MAWYRYRATFGRRWRGHLSLVLLIGLVGGIAMGAVGAARRTQSSFPAFLRRTKASDLAVSNRPNNQPGSGGYAPDVIKAIAGLPHVTHVESVVLLAYSSMVRPNGAALDVTAPLVGSVDGALFDQDRFTVTHGRMANPDRADEIMVNEFEAHALALRVGQVLTLGIDGRPPEPEKPVVVKIVGIGVRNSELVQDDVDQGGILIATPALTRPLLECCAPGTLTFLRLQHGSTDVAAVERESLALPNVSFEFTDASPGIAQVERAVKPEALAFGVFGVIAALAALLIAGQAIGRDLQIGGEDLGVLRALGAGPAMTTGDGLVGVVGTVIVGSLLAVAFALALSPLAPIGPVRKVDPSPGIAYDWTVLLGGLAVLIVGLGAVAAAAAFRTAPHRLARRQQAAARGSSAARVAAASGLSAPAVAGVRFALEGGRGRAAVPVRSAIAGTALAVVVVVATLTFGGGLHTLVSRPALYGWNWDDALQSEGPIPPQTQALLDHAPDVSAWTGVYLNSVVLDGTPVPGIAGSVRATLAPPTLAGHALEAPDEIVLGPATLAQLHKRVGDTVVASLGSAGDAANSVPPTRLRVVGTATMPAVGTGGPHPSMGTGALFATQLLPDAFLHSYGALSGPNMVFVRFRHGANRAVALRSLRKILDSTNQIFATNPDFSTYGTVVALLPVQHPAEIVNYRSMGNTPASLAGGLAAGAVVALGLTLAASVRRRRRDLALLKTIGFTRRQLAAVVAWQASVAAAVGIVVGVPLGIALGRQLWILFARSIDAVPQPTVPVTSVIVVIFGALVLANLVATLPRRSAARTPAAQVLRTG